MWEGKTIEKKSTRQYLELTMDGATAWYVDDAALGCVDGVEKYIDVHAPLIQLSFHLLYPNHNLASDSF